MIEFTHGAISPRDIQSGLASGKRMHEPITLVMKMDPATSQLWKALKQTDKLQVKVAFYRPAVQKIEWTWTDGGKTTAADDWTL